MPNPAIVFPQATTSVLGGEKAYVAKLEERLKEWDARLKLIHDLLRVKSRTLDIYDRVELESQVAALWLKREQMYAMTRNLVSADQHSWPDVKDRTEYLWSDLKYATNSVLSRLNENGAASFKEYTTDAVSLNTWHQSNAEVARKEK